MENIDIKLVEESPNNPRVFRDTKEDEDLKNSIQEKGLIYPLIVRKNGKKYQVLAGHRRLGALKALGYKEAKVIVKEVTKQEGEELMIIENLQRVDVHPYEEAKAFDALFSKHKNDNHTPDECMKHVSKITGKSIAYITQNIKLLKTNWKHL